MTKEQQEAVERLICESIAKHFDRGGGCVGGPDWEWDEEDFADVKGACAKDAASKVLLSLTEAQEAEAVEPVAGGVWETIGAVGRKPTISKHRAVNHIHLRDTIASLDARGLRAEADTIAWLVWHRLLDQQREEFLIADAKEDAQVTVSAIQADLDRAVEALKMATDMMADAQTWPFTVRKLYNVLATITKGQKR